MAWKYFNISKANQRIEQLEAENANLTKERDDFKAAAESNNSEISKQAEQLHADLEKARADLATATASLKNAESQSASANAALAAEKARADKAESDFKALKDDPSGTVQKLAAQKALEITSGQGQTPPVAATPPANPANPADTKKELFGLAKVRAAISEQIKNVK